MSIYDTAERDYAQALSWLGKAKTNGATIISRPNMYFSIDAAIAACKHMVKTTEYQIKYGGDCMGPGIHVYDGSNGCIYVFVENKQNQAGIIKLNNMGQIISRTPIKYVPFDLENHIEWIDKDLFFDGRLL